MYQEDTCHNLASGSMCTFAADAVHIAVSGRGRIHVIAAVELHRVNIVLQTTGKNERVLMAFLLVPSP